MVAPAPDSAVRVRLKCPDAEDFVARFAPNVTRGGIFLPTRDARDVGSSIRFELAVQGDRVVFAGVGVVTWVKPRGMGVKFTTLDPATEPMLERLLGQRAAAATAAASASAETADAPSPAPVAAAATDSAPTSIWREASAPASPARPAGATDTAPTSIWDGSRRRAVRPLVAGSIALVVVAVVIVSVSVGRARVGTGPSRAPQGPTPAATAEIAPPPAAPAPPVEIAAPPATPAAAREAPAPVPEPPRETAAPAPRAGGVRVESLSVGASYKGSTCPQPVTRFSVKSHRTVNVCLQVAHRPDKTDHLNLVWERNGAFSGKTPVEIPASKPTFRSRTHMRISQNRLGSWSVRAVSDRNVLLAETSFEVAP